MSRAILGEKYEICEVIFERPGACKFQRESTDLTGRKFDLMWVHTDGTMRADLGDGQKAREADLSQVRKLRGKAAFTVSESATWAVIEGRRGTCLDGEGWTYEHCQLLYVLAEDFLGVREKLDAYLAEHGLTSFDTSGLT